jgi:signal transduction histidine kinase
MRLKIRVILYLLIIPLISLAGVEQGISDKQLKPTPQLVDSLNSISYSSRRSNPRFSLEMAHRAKQHSESIKYSKGLASALHNMGTAKAVLGWFDKGLIDLIEASRIRVEIDDRGGLVSTYNNIGFIYSELKNDQKAMEFYEKAFSYIDYSEANRIISIVINNIGNVSFRSENYDKALEFYYQALRMNEENGDDRGISNTLSNIGQVYNATGDYKKGLEYLLRAYEIGKNLNDKFGMVNTLRNISELYLNQNQDIEATNYALRSMILVKELESLGEERTTVGLLAKIYERRGIYKEAAKYYKDESRLKDSLFNIQRAEAIGRIQTAYEIENQIKENEFLKKEQAINAQKIRIQRYSLFISIFFLLVVLSLLFLIIRANSRIKSVVEQLKIRNAEITLQKETIQQKANALDEKNIELQSINAIKNKLISVIAHDLKNPFNSISGYSELLLNEVSSYSEKEILTFLGIIHDSSVRGNMLLDNLLQWSRLQTRTIQFLPVIHNLDKLVKDELFFLQHKAKEKSIKIKNIIASNIEVYADSNMLKTVVRNLLSNALKFTPNKGEVTINAIEEDSSVLISVNDSGKGIEPQIKEKLFTGEAGVTTLGESGEKGTGLGLMICKDFIEKHDGEIWVESAPEKGATFFFRLPNKKKGQY